MEPNPEEGSDTRALFNGLQIIHSTAFGCYDATCFSHNSDTLLCIKGENQ